MVYQSYSSSNRLKKKKRKKSPTCSTTQFDTLHYSFLAKWQMYKKCVILASQAPLLRKYNFVSPPPSHRKRKAGRFPPVSARPASAQLPHWHRSRENCGHRVSSCFHTDSCQTGSLGAPSGCGWEWRWSGWMHPQGPMLQQSSQSSQEQRRLMVGAGWKKKECHNQYSS